MDCFAELSSGARSRDPLARNDGIVVHFPPSGTYWPVLAKRIEKMTKTGGEVNYGYRHCEPTGRANARPMTGSAKQSIEPQKGRVDCFASLAIDEKYSAVQHGPSNPRMRGSSTPRILGSIIVVSGYWIARLAGDDKPAPRFVTIASALLSRRDGRICSDDLPDGESGIFFRERAGQLFLICLSCCFCVALAQLSRHCERSEAIHSAA